MRSWSTPAERYALITEPTGQPRCTQIALQSRLSLASVTANKVNSPQEALQSVQHLNKHKLDKNHVLTVNQLDDVDRLAQVPETYEPPELKPFDAQVRCFSTVAACLPVQGWHVCGAMIVCHIMQRLLISRSPSSAITQRLLISRSPSMPSCNSCLYHGHLA